MSFWTDLLAIDYSVSHVAAGDVPTRTLRAGSGPDVVFLHGTSGHLEAFVRNIDAHAGSYRCHAIDMLGHGYTGKPNYPYEVPRYVDHLLAYLDAEGIEAAHLVGESLGGWVAAWTASEHPERVRSVQLLCSGGTRANPEVMERIRTSTRKAVETDDVELTRKRLELLMYDPASVTEELVVARHRIYHEPEFVANLDNLLCLQDMTVRQRNLLRPDRLSRLTLPTLVLWGTDNPFGPTVEAQEMHEAIPGSRLEVFEECGHWPQHEQPDRYNALSLEFLAKADG